MKTGLTKQDKTTDIWFDEKDTLIHIRTHNTALKKRLLAYSRRYPAICQQTDTLKARRKASRNIRNPARDLTNTNAALTSSTSFLMEQPRLFME